MKIPSTVLLVLTLFLMMSAAGSASAFISYLMGQEALKVVTQPEVNTEKRLKKKPLTGPYKGLELVDEKKVLVEIYNLIHSQEKSEDSTKQSQLQQSQSLVDYTSAQTPVNFNETSFPLKNSSQGVTLEVVKVQSEDNSLLLNLNLKNEGQETVRFLYSFIDVRDERGRVLSAIPDGLPGELPANGKNFSGTLKIPLALVEQTENISLTLTDYPEQKLELSLKHIPVTR